ncbi:Iron-sulfur assembly protein IscA, chloroplastic [Vitis vinifera]|uniref:Iron-sulfur assembly protein IscA, chloroplastic n=1 Tax=Vitis vinifera TaxID=29760 RepID=A0A438KJV9_VITVI|nr:Iron-sulfur assembly protein IscA, chloroplastic [Vitis vinifera]
MAFSAIPRCCPSTLRLPRNSNSMPQPSTSVSLRSLSSNLSFPKRFSIRSSSVSAAPTTGGLMPAISLTDNALKHLNKMRSDRTEDLCLRIGVKQGGCSGMSYTMEFEDRAKTRPDDSIIEYNGFVIDYSHHKLVNYQSTFCDPKSLLFVFGMQLDFSDALIGGGFSFKNPNATQTCGCGKSLAAEM